MPDVRIPQFTHHKSSGKAVVRLAGVDHHDFYGGSIKAARTRVREICQECQRLLWRRHHEGQAASGWQSPWSDQERLMESGKRRDQDGRLTPPRRERRTL